MNMAKVGIVSPVGNFFSPRGNPRQQRDAAVRAIHYANFRSGGIAAAQPAIHPGICHLPRRRKISTKGFSMHAKEFCDLVAGVSSTSLADFLSIDTRTLHRYKSSEVSIPRAVARLVRLRYSG